MVGKDQNVKDIYNIYMKFKIACQINAQSLDCIYVHTERFLQKPGFHAVCYIGTMPRLVQIETWFFGIIYCTLGSK